MTELLKSFSLCYECAILQFMEIRDQLPGDERVHTATVLI